MSRAAWYWIENGSQEGPLGTDELREELQHGRLSWSTPVWRSGMDRWQPAMDVDDLRPRPATIEVEAPAWDARDHLAPLPRRILAAFLDLFLIWAATSLVALIASPLLPPQGTQAYELISAFVVGGVYWLYFTAHEGGGRRASLGKAIVGLEVVRAKGDTLSTPQAALRSAIALLWIGWLFIFLGRERQCLHDRLVDSYVVVRDDRRREAEETV